MKKIMWYLVAAIGLSLRSQLASAAIPDATTVANKWEQNTTGAAEAYASGVANTDKDPTALAIAAGQRLRSNFLAAFDTGKWANNLRKAGKAKWQANVASKGQANFSTGVSAAKETFAQAIAPVLAFESNLQTQVKAMPNVTDTDRENRMLAWSRGMRKYQKS